MTKRSKFWKVHKFGGSSLKDAYCFNHVTEIILSSIKEAPSAVVVSAIYGVTNKLHELVCLAIKQDDKYQSKLKELYLFHRSLLQDLCNKEQQQVLLQGFEHDFDSLANILKAIYLAKDDPQSAVSLVVGYGEQWSSMILYHLLVDKVEKVRHFNARKFLITSQEDFGPYVHWRKTRENFTELNILNNEDCLVFTGYIATTPTGKPTTLKRNGSDHTASIVASLLSASEIHIWSDVDGVFTADPNKVEDAQLLPHISYEEASESAYFGSKVVHPKTMEPAVFNDIPIFVKNTFKPKALGTKISKRKCGVESTRDPKKCVKLFSVVEDVSLISVEGTGMIGVSGVAQRLFSTLHQANISVIMISQASSEHSICFVIRQSECNKTLSIINNMFSAAIHQGKIQQISAKEQCCIVAAVGDQMINTPGVAARFFGALGQLGINILAIAQGSSERNISAVIDSKNSVRALQVLHSRFILSDYLLSLGLIGCGKIGSTLITQLQSSFADLRKNFNVEICLRGILRSQSMCLDTGNILEKDWHEYFKKYNKSYELKKFVDHIDADNFSHRVIVDCSASEEISKNYESWLARGISVITPNKKANTLSLNYFNKLNKNYQYAYYLYEGTVGAGLPVISTLKDLLRTGDRIEKIEGVFSGTLSYIFNNLDKDKLFSSVVKRAYDDGLTEPDVRDDLSGMDVARKILILSRLMGQKLELSQVQVESLIPEAIANEKDSKKFIEKLSNYDVNISKKVQTAYSNNQQLVYLGSIDNKGQASAKIVTIEYDHPFSRLKGTDNIVAFYTQRYREQPLLIQGPGAGKEVTAAGVFADILRLVSFLGANI